MRKTTIYLPDELKKKIEKLAKKEKRSEADIIRQAIAVEISRRTAPRPRIPMPGLKLREKNVSERVDELLDGFGR